MNKEGPTRPFAAADALRQLAPADWARFGAEQIAYIRPVLVDGNPAVAIHAADGTQIGAAPDASLATAAILQHEMLPVLVH
ncbi:MULTISPECIES: DUF1150 family protein [Roseomonas]|uniref:DUF1150 domain-containing protein n=2 Tax=Roseomonas TaxID=125216 RepID=A0A2C7AHF0_9PROT|nr:MULTISPECIES: DUF1150 family protein [Pseudoroseomonas]PHK96646.1 hypothetical protein CR162_01640 [Pseudoroseomonas rhizosphaerae]PWC28171.1 hypothetical protein CR165_14685 [Pseudoroseomonas aestuarii]